MLHVVYYTITLYYTCSTCVLHYHTVPHMLHIVYYTITLYYT